MQSHSSSRSLVLQSHPQGGLAQQGWIFVQAWLVPGRHLVQGFLQGVCSLYLGEEYEQGHGKHIDALILITWMI